MAYLFPSIHSSIRSACTCFLVDSEERLEGFTRLVSIIESLSPLLALSVCFDKSSEKDSKSLSLEGRDQIKTKPLVLLQLEFSRLDQEETKCPLLRRRIEI